MKKKMLLFLAFMMLLMPVLSGCRRTPPQSVELTYSDPEHLLTDEIIGSFEATGFVTLKPSENEDEAQLLISAPDQWHTYWDKGLYRECPSKLYQDMPWLSKKLDTCRQLLGSGQTLWAIPQTAWQCSESQPTFLVYRKDWVDSSEFSDEELSKPLTWNRFVELIQSFTGGDPDGDGAVDTWGLMMSQNALRSTWFSYFGIRDFVIEDNLWIPGLLSNRAKQAMGWLNQLQREGSLYVYGDETDEETMIWKFANGQTGMIACSDLESVEQHWKDGNPNGAETLEKSVCVLHIPQNPWNICITNPKRDDMVVLVNTSVEDEDLKLFFKAVNAVKNRNADKKDWQSRCLSQVSEDTGRYGWLQPMFTDFMKSETVDRYISELNEKAASAFGTGNATAGDAENAWKNWLETARGLNGEEVFTEVRNAADRWHISKEE